MRPLGAIQVTRRRRAAYVTDAVNFTREPGAATDTTIWASIQPLSMSEQQRLQELFDVPVTHKAYTTDGLRPKNEENDTPEDLVQYNGLWYRVTARDSHSWGLAHDKVYLVEM